ncbi:MAG: rhodanese-like domain-containing protein [Thermodesulfobacteriota bacterium]
MGFSIKIVLLLIAGFFIATLPALAATTPSGLVFGPNIIVLDADGNEVRSGGGGEGDTDSGFELIKAPEEEEEEEEEAVEKELPPEPVEATPVEAIPLKEVELTTPEKEPVVKQSPVEPVKATPVKPAKPVKPLRLITKEELLRRIESGQDIIVIDTRSSHAYQKSYHKVLGAYRIPLSHIKRVAPKIPKGRDIVVYCDWAGEAISRRAAAKLLTLGFKHVKVLKGGYKEWRFYGFPVEVR